MTRIEPTPSNAAIATAAAADVIDRLAGLNVGDPIHAVRHRRDKVVAATQGSYDALFDPALAALPLSERLLVSLHVCRRTPSPMLAEHYRALLTASDAPADLVDALDRGDTQRLAALAPPRLRAMLRFAQVLTEEPIDGDRKLLLTLPANGLTTEAAVALGQLIAFLSYQVRLVVGLSAMRALAPVESATAHSRAHPVSGATASSEAVSPAAGGSASASAAGGAATPGAPLRIKGFTSEQLGWKAWLDVVDLAAASAEQIAVLDESHPQARTMDYYRLLVHQPRILVERSRAFNAIMYAPGGQSRAERELAATVTSRVNGCVYCASVHAQRFEQLAKRNDVIAQVFDDPASAGTSERERAIIAFSIALTLDPQRVDAAAIAQLRAAGLVDAEVLDLVHSIAIFAWANRLMLNLGEPVYS